MKKIISIALNSSLIGIGVALVASGIGDIISTLSTKKTVAE